MIGAVGGVRARIFVAHPFNRITRKNPPPVQGETVLRSASNIYEVKPKKGEPKIVPGKVPEEFLRGLYLDTVA